MSWSWQGIKMAQVGARRGPARGRAMAPPSLAYTDLGGVAGSATAVAPGPLAPTRGLQRRRSCEPGLLSSSEKAASGLATGPAGSRPPAPPVSTALEKSTRELLDACPPARPTSPTLYNNIIRGAPNRSSRIARNRPQRAKQAILGRSRFQFFGSVSVGFSTSARVLRIAVLTLFASAANSFRCSLIFLPFSLNSVASW